MGFGELDKRSSALACGFAASGVKVGDRIAILVSNRVEFVIALVAALKAGAVSVALNPRLSASEIGYIVRDAAPRAVIFENGTREAVRGAEVPEDIVRICVDSPAAPGELLWDQLLVSDGELPDIPPDFDDCLISYTSGTTGKPKGAIITQANYIVSNGYINAQQMGICERDRILTTTPLAHRTAFSRLINMLCLGSTVVVMPRFDAQEATRLIETESVTVLGIVPTVGRLLLPEIEADPARFDSVRLAVVAGEAFPVELKVRLQRALPRIKLYAFFGMTELGALTILGPEEQVTKAASVGRVNPGAEVRIVDDALADVAPGEAGEILVRSGAPGRFLTMRGYFNNPQATAEAMTNGWLRTGDIGRFDSDGYLYIVDRKKDMVISGGYNIYSKEVEATILEIEGVEDVAVIGVPDAIYGEAVAAFIEVGKGAAPEASRVVEHCRARIASYKKPRIVRFVERLPRNGTGKVLKFELRAAFLRGEG